MDLNYNLAGDGIAREIGLLLKRNRELRDKKQAENNNRLPATLFFSPASSDMKNQIALSDENGFKYKV